MSDVVTPEWVKHAVFYQIFPDQFIPLAEATGLMAPLTEWALEAALRQNRAWADGGLTLDVAVNLSKWSLHDPALPGLVAALPPHPRLCRNRSW